MVQHLDEILAAVRRPDAITPDPLGGRWRYWRRGSGPAAWLFVVVDWLEPQAEVITSYGKGKVQIP